MVDFGNSRRRLEPSNRAKLEPSRSLPLSALNRRERSNLPSSSFRQRTPRKVAAATTCSTFPPDLIRAQSHQSSYSPPATPNPYHAREVVRRTPARANSHVTYTSSMSPPRASLAATQQFFHQDTKNHNHNDDHSDNDLHQTRSHSPSKYPTESSFSNLLVSTCQASMECCIPHHPNQQHYDQQSQQQVKHQQRHNNRRSFGVLKSLLRALTLVLVGFGGGVIYNMYETSGVSAHIQLESVPTDELVQKLAHDNQVQQEEIEHLKEQVVEITSSKSIQYNQQQQQQQQQQQRSQPQVIYKSAAVVKEQEEAAAAEEGNGGRLRAGKQGREDEPSNTDKNLGADSDQAQEPGSSAGGAMEQQLDSAKEDIPLPEAPEPIRREYVSAIDPLPSYVPAEEEHGGAPRPAPVGGGKMPPPPKGKRIPLHMQHEVHHDNGGRNDASDNSASQDAIPEEQQ